MQHNGQSWYNYLIPPTSVQTLHITRYFMLKSVRWYKRFYTCRLLKSFQNRVWINPVALVRHSHIIKTMFQQRINSIVNKWICLVKTYLFPYEKTVKCYALPIYNCYAYCLCMVKAIFSHAKELPIRLTNMLPIRFNQYPTNTFFNTIPICRAKHAYFLNCVTCF